MDPTTTSGKVVERITRNGHVEYETDVSNPDASSPARRSEQLRIAQQRAFDLGGDIRVELWAGDQLICASEPPRYGHWPRPIINHLRRLWHTHHWAGA
jgi:hypothetical protein